MSAAGKYIDRVSIQQRSNPAARDDHGQPVDAWTTLVTRWANVEETDASEQQYADGVTEIPSHTVTLRYYAGLNGTMRLLWGSRILNILGSTNPDGKRIESVVKCLEEVSTS